MSQSFSFRGPPRAVVAFPAAAAAVVAAAALGGVAGCAPIGIPPDCPGPMSQEVVDARRFPAGPSGVNIPAGTTAFMSSNGMWSVGGPYGMFGPDGAIGRHEAGALVPTAPMGALVGSYDGRSWFLIGRVARVPGGGQLWLSANDTPPAGNFTDNSGTLNVLVSQCTR
jgi:hypothetical protein